MQVRMVLLNNIKIIISLSIVFCSIVFHNELKNLYDNFINNTNEQEGIYSELNLSQYNGDIKNKLYIAVLGVIFDVTEGRKHYEKGASYHYFIGKDGSRSLITGNFKDESKDKDHVLDLSCRDIFTLLHWKDTFNSKYKKVGILSGRFYDNKGQKTDYTIEFDNRIKQCEMEKEMAHKEDIEFPPCNIAWSTDEGTKVWCTKSSGGVVRNWVGVPRQLFTPGVETPRCVCVNNSRKESSIGLIKEYSNCPITSSTCMVNT